VQAVVLPIADRHAPYAESVAARLRDAGLRVEVDARSESVNRRIRDTELRKVPYMLVVGDRELEGGQAALRAHGRGDEGSAPVEEIVERLADQASNRLA
jgi:threonyl-tRNA synthetase